VRARIRDICGSGMAAEMLLLNYNGGVLFHEDTH
jgi:hypothetical protein